MGEPLTRPVVQAFDGQHRGSPIKSAEQIPSPDNAEHLDIDDFWCGLIVVNP